MRTSPARSDACGTRRRSRPDSSRAWPLAGLAGKRYERSASRARAARVSGVRQPWSGRGGAGRRRRSIAAPRRCRWATGVCSRSRAEGSAGSPSRVDAKLSAASIASATSSSAVRARDGRKGNMCSLRYPPRRMDLHERSA